MIEHRRLMRRLARACYGAGLMFAGAVALTMYLAHANPLFDGPLLSLRASLTFAFSTFFALGAWLRPAGRDSEVYRAAKSWSGVGFIVVTGLAATAILGWGATTVERYIAAATVLIATFVVAAMLWPVATERADGIG
jgi:hypothetical protein